MDLPGELRLMSGFEPVYDTGARRESACHAGGDQVSAGGRFPIEHFACTEHAGYRTEHQMFIKRFECHTASAADSFIQRPWRDQGNL